MDKGMYVIRFNTGTFWCGYNVVSPQLRKAKIYTSLKKADEYAKEALERFKDNKITFIDTKCRDIGTEYNICELELRIKSIIK